MEDISHPLSRESLSRVLTGFVVTFIHALWGYVLISVAGELRVGTFYANQFSQANLFVGIVLFLAIFVPFIFLILYYFVLRTQQSIAVWKLFFAAEVPLFAASWLVVFTQYGGLAGIFLYTLAIVGVVGYTTDALGKDAIKSRLERFLPLSALAGSGIMTYAFIIWSFFFVAVMSQFGYIFAGIIDMVSGGFTYGYYGVADFFFGLLYLAFLAIIFMSPLYLVGAYWYFLARQQFVLFRMKNEKVLQLVLRLLTFVGVFGVASLLNGSVYAPKHSMLQLMSQQDFVSLYESKDLKNLFVNQYRKELGYLGAKSDSRIGYDLYCYSDTSDTRCDTANKVLTFLLTPFLYQREVVVSYPGNVSAILERAYDGKIPSSVDVEEIIRAVQRYEPRYYGKYYYDTVSYMPPMRPQIIKQVILRKVVNNTTVSIQSGMQQSVLDLEFDNLATSNQEAQLLLRLPVGSVVTGLKLGENLEMTGIVAPKGAANTVYENSVVRRIDPALVTQLGPSTYSLKVFPIFPNRYGGKIQRVQITYSSPVTNDLSLPMLTSIANTDIDYKSIVSGTVTVVTTVPFKVTSDTAVLSKPVSATSSWGSGYSFSWSFDQFASFMGTEHRVVIDQKVTPYCVEQTRSAKKAVIYLDVSLSSKKYRGEYETFINGLIRNYESVSIVLYNGVSVGNREVVTMDNSAAYMKDIMFWGYSSNTVYQDLLRITNEDEDAFVVADSETYVFEHQDVDEDEYLDYSISKGKVFVAFAGGYKDLPEQVRYIATATGGSMHSLSQVLGHLSAGCLTITGDQSSTVPPEIGSIRNIMQLVRENNKKVSQVVDHDSLVEQGRKMYVIAGRNGFVDILNSLIALETEAQMQQLRTEIEKEQAFDSSTTQPPARIMRDSVVGAWAPNVPSSSGLFNSKLGVSLEDANQTGSVQSNNGSTLVAAIFTVIGVGAVVMVFTGFPIRTPKKQ